MNMTKKEYLNNIIHASLLFKFSLISYSLFLENMQVNQLISNRIGGTCVKLNELLMQDLRPRLGSC